MTQTVTARTEEKVNTFRYLITKFNEAGWADAQRSLPIPFDLVTVWTSTDKKVAAWWNNHKWEGLRLREGDQVLFWKRRRYEHVT